MIATLTRAMPYLRRIRRWLFVAVCFLFISPFLLSCMEYFDGFHVVDAAITEIESHYHVGADQINIVYVSKPDLVGPSGGSYAWIVDYTLKGVPGEHQVGVDRGIFEYFAVSIY